MFINITHTCKHSSVMLKLLITEKITYRKQVRGSSKGIGWYYFWMA